MTWLDDLLATFVGYLIAYGLFLGGAGLLGVLVYDIAFHRGWRKRGEAEARAAVLAAAEDAVATTVRLPAQRRDGT